MLQHKMFVQCMSTAVRVRTASIHTVATKLGSAFVNSAAHPRGITVRLVPITAVSPRDYRGNPTDTAVIPSSPLPCSSLVETEG